MAQLVKNPPAVWETWVWSLGGEDPLVKGTATHSSILVWRIPWTISSMGVTKSQTQLSDFHFHFIKWNLSKGKKKKQARTLILWVEEIFLKREIGKIAKKNGTLSSFFPGLALPTGPGSELGLCCFFLCCYLVLPERAEVIQNILKLSQVREQQS